MKKNKIKKLLTALAILCFIQGVHGQNKKTDEATITLTLEQTIGIATDSSLTAFIAQNAYLSGYWRYRSFKAERLPSLSLNSTPIQYYENFVKRYDSQNNVDVYKQQKSIYASAGLSLQQNFDPTGGVFSLNTDLDYLRNFGADKSTQFSSIPFRLGYSQSLFGHNSFKWDKRIEPLQYEKAKKSLLFDLENISEEVTSYFFSHALNQVLYDIALQNTLSSDTLFQMGQERHQLGNITQADLLTLRLNAINAQNDLSNAQINLDKSAFMLASFLRYNPNTRFHLVLPEPSSVLAISWGEALSMARENNPKLPELALRLLAAQRNLDQVKKSARFSASVSASVGFNQAAHRIGDVYNDPLRQNIVSVSLRVPLLDWGVNKGKINVAQSELNTALISNKQAEEAFEQEVILAVRDFNMRYAQIVSAKEARKVAELAYNATYQRFFIGKTDVDGLNMALNRKNEAQRNYINALLSYWQNYYKIRKYTLYNFETKQPIQVNFENLPFIRKSNMR